jgi:hypothetical protein
MPSPLRLHALPVGGGVWLLRAERVAEHQDIAVLLVELANAPADAEAGLGKQR